MAYLTQSGTRCSSPLDRSPTLPRPPGTSGPWRHSRVGERAMTADARTGPVFRQPGTVLTDHVFTVPLDHHRPDGEQIEVFAREVAPAGRRDGGPALPWLVFLQGGPGFGSPR